MINKKGIWFVTLFSMILVLSMYYISLKEDSLSKYKIKKIDKDTTTIKEVNNFTSLRINDDEEVLKEMEDLQNTLLNEESTLEEKNNAYEALQTINTNKGKESELEEIIKKEYKLNSFIKIKNDHITIIIESNKHDSTLVNNIMNTIQSNFDYTVYTIVKFQ